MKKAIKNIITFTTLSAISLHVANKVIEDKATRKHILSTKDGHFYKWRHGDIFYTKEGSGPSLLLIHNLSTESSSYEWSKMKHQLSKQYTVYAIDLLGCGRSEKPGITYTNYIYVCLINDFIKNIIGESTSVICSGLSASFTLMSASEPETLIDKIILINPIDINEITSSVNVHCPIYKKIYNLPIIGTYIYNVIMRRSYIRSKFSEEYCTKKYFVTPDMVDAYYESCHLGNSNGKFLYSSIHNNYLNADIKLALKKINTPILIIQSELEATCTDNISLYTENNSGIINTTILGTKGMPHVENSRRTCDAICEFL